MEVLAMLRGVLSVAVALDWCVENGEISALYWNSHNKLLSVLGALCLLHQHLAQSVFLLPMFSTSSPFCNGRNFAVMPGRAVTLPGAGAWHGGHRVTGRKEREAPKSLPAPLVTLSASRQPPYLDKKGCGSAGWGPRGRRVLLCC